MGGSSQRAASLKAYAILFAIAFFLRLLFTVQTSDDLFFDVSGLDSNTYHEQARGFVKGEWPAEEAFFRPPLYSLFRGVIYATLGESLWAFKLVQAALGALGCGLTFSIARRLFPRCSGFVPWCAALIHALHGTLIYFDAQPLSGSLDVVLELGVLLALLHAGERPSSSSRWAIAGLLIGLTALNRASIVIFVPLVCWWIWRLQREGDATTRASRSIGVLLVALVLILAPVAWHNARFDEAPVSPAQTHQPDASRGAAFGRLAGLQFSPIASSLGVNFYLGNHSRVGGRNDIHHPEHFELYGEVVDEPLKQGITSASGRSAYLVRVTLRDMAENPGSYARRVGEKFVRLVNGAEITRNSNLYAHRDTSSLLSALLWKFAIAFPSGLLFPLAIVGLFFARGSGPGHTLVVLRLALHAAFLLCFFVTARYRLPLLPIAGIYAAFALETLHGCWKEGKRALVTRSSLAVFGLLVLCNVGVPVRQDHALGEYYVLGLEASRRGDLEKATRAYRELLEEDPASTEAHDRLANALVRMASSHPAPSSVEANELFEQAERHYREAIRLTPELALLHSHLGSLLSRRDRLDEALAAYEEALRLVPDFAHVYVNIAAVLEFRGEREAAIRNYRRALELEPGNVRARNKLEALLQK